MFLRGAKPSHVHASKSYLILGGFNFAGLSWNLKNEIKGETSKPI